MGGRRCLVVGLLLAALAAPAGAEAAVPPTTPELIEAAERRGDISSDRANLYLAYAFGDPASLPSEYRSSSPWDGTFVLRDLQRDAKRMPQGRLRARVEGEIGAQHAGATCSTSNDPLPNSADSAFFHIDYDTIGGGLDIGDYAQSLDATWSTEVTSFGWAAPPVLASNPPPGSRYHVRIDSLGGGLYGFVTSAGTHAGFVGNNPNTGWNDTHALASCMVLNDDYTGFPGGPQQALDATTAHEFNHSLQYGYGAAGGPNEPDFIFFEGGATWMEDEVHDAANDSYNYLWPTFADSMGEYDQSPYAYWITFRGLTERFGTGVAGAGEQVMQEFWEGVSQSPSAATDLTTLNQALASKGNTLAQGFHDYAIAVKYNRTCGAGYVAPFCFEEGGGYLATAGPTPVHGTIGSVDVSATASIEDNYSLGWIALPTAGTYSVRLENLSTTGGALRGTVACDNGTSLTLLGLPAVVGPSGSAQLENFSPAGCSSPVAVVTNQAQTAANPASSSLRQFRVSAVTPATTDRPLSVTRAGSGAGTVTGSDAGIDCGADCTEPYADGTVVGLTATPAPGSVFAGWIGACSGTGVCALTMDAAKSVTAVFTAPPSNPGGNDPGGGQQDGGGTGGGETPVDSVAPRVTRLRMSARRFRAARSGPGIAAPLGTRVRFSLSEPGRTTFVVERRTAGRRVGGRCRRATRRNRGRRACVRWVRVRGSFAVNGVAGSKSFRFRGRVGGRRLRVGRYRLVATARDGAGNRSAARRLTFRIVRR